MDFRLLTETESIRVVARLSKVKTFQLMQDELHGSIQARSNDLFSAGGGVPTRRSSRNRLREVRAYNACHAFACCACLCRLRCGEMLFASAWQWAPARRRRDPACSNARAPTCKEEASEWTMALQLFQARLKKLASVRPCVPGPSSTAASARCGHLRQCDLRRCPRKKNLLELGDAMPGGPDQGRRLARCHEARCQDDCGGCVRKHALSAASLWLEPQLRTASGAPAGRDAGHRCLQQRAHCVRQPRALAGVCGVCLPSALRSTRESGDPASGRKPVSSPSPRQWTLKGALTGEAHDGDETGKDHCYLQRG